MRSRAFSLPLSATTIPVCRILRHSHPRISTWYIGHGAGFDARALPQKSGARRRERPPAFNRRSLYDATRLFKRFLTYSQMLDAIEQDRPFSVPGKEGLRNQLVLDAAYRSLQTDRAESPEPF